MKYVTDMEEQHVMLEIQCTEYKKKEQNMDGMEFDGADDLISGMEDALRKYPDLVEDGLKRNKKILKKQ